MEQRVQLTSYRNEAEQQAAGAIFKLIVATGIALMVAVLVGIYYRDMKVIATLSVGITILIVPYILLRVGRVSSASITLTLLLIGILTASAMVGQGINDLAIVAFPIIYFFTSLSLNRTVFKISLGFTLLAIFWLTFGELNGLYVPTPFPPISWVEFLIVAVVLGVAAFTSDLLATSLRKNLERAERELTERKQAEEALRESEAKYRRLFTQIADPIFIFAKETLNILDCNQSALNSYEYTLKELRNMTPRQLHPPEDQMDVDKNINDEHSNNPNRYTHITKSGKALYVEINTTSLEYNGQDAWISIVRDITERKQAEERRLSLETQLRQAQKLEAIGTMVGGISHEFNNVLQSMFLHAGLVQDELPENEELRASFQHILDDGNRARDLIKQVLTFSRKAKVELEPQPIHDMIMDVLVLERASLPANIDIQQDIDMNCGPVLCDKTQIHQIIMNLCNNARHALEEKGGNLTVSLKPTQASLSEGDPEIDTLELKVSDTGHGIDAADLERIFDPFFTTKQFGKGTGLGLSAVHGIVEMMGGHISVTSEIGKGTTFKILFPMTDAVEEAELAKSSAVPKPMSHRSILLVDDEDSIREAVKTILTNIGFDVDSAPDGHQALELFKANNGKYDLIVTDQSMPKMSGVELTQAIRNTNPEIPIILSTGHLGVEEEQGFKDIGITAFIQKPWTADELIARIQELDVK